MLLEFECTSLLWLSEHSPASEGGVGFMKYPGRCPRLLCVDLSGSVGCFC